MEFIKGYEALAAVAAGAVVGLGTLIWRGVRANRWYRNSMETMSSILEQRDRMDEFEKEVRGEFGAIKATQNSFRESIQFMAEGQNEIKTEVAKLSEYVHTKMADIEGRLDRKDF